MYPILKYRKLKKYWVYYFHLYWPALLLYSQLLTFILISLAYLHDVNFQINVDAWFSLRIEVNFRKNLVHTDQEIRYMVNEEIQYVRNFIIMPDNLFFVSFARYQTKYKEIYTILWSYLKLDFGITNLAILFYYIAHKFL